MDLIRVAAGLAFIVAGYRIIPTTFDAIARTRWFRYRLELTELAVTAAWIMTGVLIMS